MPVAHVSEDHGEVEAARQALDAVCPSVPPSFHSLRFSGCGAVVTCVQQVRKQEENGMGRHRISNCWPPSSSRPDWLRERTLLKLTTHIGEL